MHCMPPIRSLLALHRAIKRIFGFLVSLGLLSGSAALAQTSVTTSATVTRTAQSGPDYDHAVQHDGQPDGHGQVVDFDQEPDHDEQVEHHGCGHGKVQLSTSTKTKTDGASDLRCKTNKNTKSAKPKM